MLTITDRDLLVLDPGVFIGSAAAAGDTLLTTTADASIDGTELASASADFEANDIGFGHVAVVNNAAAVEVVSRTDPTTIEVSKPRTSSLDAKIPPGDAADAAITVITFSRLIEQARAWTLGSLGIDDESLITNPGPVSRLIALRAIARAYRHAAALEPDNASLVQRAALAVDLASQAARQTLVSIDLNGDGIPESTRAAGVLVFSRA